MPVTKTRTLLRSALVVALAAASAGCIVVPRDPWGGHHGRRGGHHLDQQQPVQPHMHDQRQPRRDGGYR